MTDSFSLLPSWSNTNTPINILNTNHISIYKARNDFTKFLWLTKYSVKNFVYLQFWFKEAWLLQRLLSFDMCLRPFNGKGPCPFLQAGSHAARGKRTVSGIPSHINYCVTVTVYTYYKCGHGYIIQTGRPHATNMLGDPCFNLYQKSKGI
jgi:hypothetical protein